MLSNFFRAVRQQLVHFLFDMIGHGIYSLFLGPGTPDYKPRVPLFPPPPVLVRKAHLVLHEWHR